MNVTSSQTPRQLRSRVSGALLTALALAAGPSELRAQDVYESVDAQGHVVYSDQSAVSAAEPYVPQDEAQSPPRVIHVCWTNCFTLVGEQGVYGRTDGTDENWTVERFTPDTFVLKRHDAPAAWNGYQAEVTYEGQVANDQLINVLVDGRPVGTIQMAWGDALDTLPGSNAERDRLAQNGPSAPAGEPAPDVATGAPLAATGAPLEASEAPLEASEAPPPLPDEDQPPCAVADSIWTPGYWVWVARRYYWIPGAWVRPPHSGLLWTPGYWTFVGGAYAFRPGVWRPYVGYYGGINYGHGYFGSGYSGGRWVNSAFVYNTAVSHVNTTVIRSTYSEPPMGVANSKVSYHGGLGGTTAPPPPQEHLVFAEPHPMPPLRPAPTAVRQLAHVAQNHGEHTPRNAVRHSSVANPIGPHRQLTNTPRPTPASGRARLVSHSRPTGLQPHP